MKKGKLTVAFLLSYFYFLYLALKLLFNAAKQFNTGVCGD